MAEIIRAIQKRDLRAYHGIMITHGTDTLPYTAAALCYGLDLPNIPVVLVSSNYAPDDRRSNALINFSSAMDFILNQQLPGFYVVFANSDGKVYVHIASRLLEADWICNDFKSFGNIPLGTLDHRGLCYVPSPKNPTMIDLYNPYGDLVPLVDDFKNDVLGLKAYPGFDYQAIVMKDNVKAVLHSQYHCGSGNVIGEGGTSLINFIVSNRHGALPYSYKDVSDVFTIPATV